MILKNVSKEVVSARWNGINYSINPDEALDLQAFKPATREEEIAMAERFEKKSGQKLQRVVDVAKEPRKHVITPQKEADVEKLDPDPKNPENVKPVKPKEEKDPDGKPYKHSAKKGGKK
ncbi:MAG: hypothetical protein WC738_04330 [Candidatus Omnitrophota bacterium]|jgi:uncharacterized protein YggE